MTSTIRCPKCGYQRDIPADRLPGADVRAKCPRCAATFTVAEGLLVEHELVIPPQAEEPAVVPDPVLAAPVRPAEPVAVLPTPPSSREERIEPFIFTGNAKEYFGIWIVNTLLRIVTLGIYSPWAKVRTRRYFYANTLLGNAPFDYLADPLAILKGWGIAAAFFLIYSFVSNLYPTVHMVLSSVFFLVIPWVIVRSRMFHCRNSSHRNIRFNFRPKYSDAYAVFAGLPILSGLTLGILAPFMVFKQNQYLVENTAYGETFLRFGATPKQFYGIYLRAVAGLVAAGIAVAIIVGGLFTSGKVPFPNMDKAGPEMAPWLAFIPFLLFAVLYLVIGVYVGTAQSNLIWNNTKLGDHRFSSTMKYGEMLWLMISSAAVIPLSLGLLIPWVKIRMTRYRLENLSLVAVGDLDAFAAGASEDLTATGEEIGDFFGVDFGI